MFTLFQLKVSPGTVNLAVPSVSTNSDWKDQKRLFLENAIAAYFAFDEKDIRLYKATEKVFTWTDDVWPFYRQKIDPNYAGAIIS